MSRIYERVRLVGVRVEVGMGVGFGGGKLNEQRWAIRFGSKLGVACRLESVSGLTLAQS